MPKMFDPKEEAKKLDPFLKVLPFVSKIFTFPAK